MPPAHDPIDGLGPFIGDTLVVTAVDDGCLWVSDGRCAVHESLLWHWAADRFPRGLYPGVFALVPSAAPRVMFRWQGGREDATDALRSYLGGVDTMARLAPDVDPVTGYPLALAIPGVDGGVALPLENPAVGVVYVELEQVRALWPNRWGRVMNAPAAQPYDDEAWLVLGKSPTEPVVVEHRAAREGAPWKRVAVFAHVDLTPAAAA